MGDEIWILGATGRVGRGVAARLSAAGVPLVLHGRDRARLEALTGDVNGSVRVFAGSLDAALGEIAASAPAAVVNTIGPFAETAEKVAHACPPGTHYVDMGNELPAAEAILALDGLARSQGQTLVASAGFGVYATEAALLHALADGSGPAAATAGSLTPRRVRVDSVASVASQTGALGEALAHSIVGSIAFGGRVVRGGRLVRAATGSDPASFETPDGDAMTSSSWASTDLLAAWRASGAGEVVAASVLAPTGAARRLLPAVSALIRIPGAAGFAVGRLARVKTSERPAPRAHSWARAVVEWQGGRVVESWLRVGEGMDFTVAVTSEVALRLARGEARPGAFTAGSLFGESLVAAVGGEFS